MENHVMIGNSEALIAALGCWPLFHDARVVAAARLDDAQSVSIHVFNMTDRVDENGYFELECHHRVELLFTGIEKNTLPIDYSSDCLDRLIFDRLDERPDSKIVAWFSSHLDADGEIICDKVEVISVVPCTDQGEIIMSRHDNKHSIN